MSRAASAFHSYVRRSDDRRLERTLGSPRGLRFLFGRAARAYRPDVMPALAGDLAFDLRLADGTHRPWTVAVGPAGATARAGEAASPALLVRTGVADFIRIAAGEIDTGGALLDGRLDIEGDFDVAQQLGAMFGRSGPY